MKYIDGLYIESIYKGAGIEITNSSYHGYEYYEAAYHCVRCGTNFKVVHRLQSYMGGSNYNDSAVTCPACSQRWTNYKSCKDFQTLWGYQGTKGDIPISADMKISEYKEKVALDIRYDTILLDSTGYCQKSVQFERFTYDIKNRKAFYAKSKVRNFLKDQEVELSDPFGKRELFTNSMIKYISHFNHCCKVEKKVVTLLKDLRETVCRKYKETYGFKPRAYVSRGKGWGMMARQLFNLGLKMRFSDIDLLPDWTAVANKVGTVEWMSDSYRQLLIDNKDKSTVGDVDRILDAFTIPKSAITRKIISKNPLTAQVLKFCMCKAGNKADVAAGLYETCMKFISRINANTESLKIIDYIAYWLTYRSISEVQNFLNKGNISSWQIKDTYNMEMKLNDKNRKLYLSEHIKLAEAHDWLVKVINSQKGEDYSLKVPEYIKHRYEVPVDGFTAHVPLSANELLAVGNELHNCVGTYADKVLAHERWICVIAKGNELIACLEIKENCLVQAKLKYNKSVKEDTEINDTILKWCKEARILIDTKDIDKEKVSKAA